MKLSYSIPIENIISIYKKKNILFSPYAYVIVFIIALIVPKIYSTSYGATSNGIYELKKLPFYIDVIQSVIIISCLLFLLQYISINKIKNILKINRSDGNAINMEVELKEDSIEQKILGLNKKFQYNLSDFLKYEENENCLHIYFIKNEDFIIPKHLPGYDQFIYELKEKTK